MDTPDPEGWEGSRRTLVRWPDGAPDRVWVIRFRAVRPRRRFGVMAGLWFWLLMAVVIMVIILSRQ